MIELRKEVRDLIVANEKIQSAVLGGTQLTDDEMDLLRMCARELLAIPAAGLVKGSRLAQ